MTLLIQAISLKLTQVTDNNIISTIVGNPSRKEEKMVDDARSQISTRVPFQELRGFILTWILLYHGVFVFVLSCVAGAFIFPGFWFEYAWKVTLAALVLSLPAAIDTVRKDLNFTDIALEYAGWGYLGGVAATVILAVANLWLHVGLTLNQGVAFVALFALATGGGFAWFHKYMQDLNKAAPS